MSGYTPYRGIESVEDLLLVNRTLESTPTAVELPADAHYPEITIWVRTACPEDDLFADDDRTLLHGVPSDGVGWRLVLTAHGYLRFEAGEGENAVSCTSAVPVHSAVDSSEGLKLGFGGAVTFDRALQLRRLAQSLPLDALVMETDAPDIPPHWLYRTQEARAAGEPQGRNEPAELPRIAAAVAGLRGIEVAQLAAATCRNAVAALPRLEGLISL